VISRKSGNLKKEKVAARPRNSSFFQIPEVPTKAVTDLLEPKTKLQLHFDHFFKSSS